jgi:hypothetical protein
MANPEMDNYCTPQVQADLYEAEQRLRKAEDILDRLGYRRCDIPACNCGGYHYHLPPTVQKYA